MVHFALLPRVPTYATMMYVTHAWHGGTRRLRKWILRQLATALDDGDAAQREAVLYALWVDFFEVTDTARLTFPYLWRTVRDHAAVLERSGPVPWAVKREALAEAARTPTLHEPLARAIAHGRDGDPTGAAIFCVEGHREELRRTIGASVLVWPPGIFDEDRPTSGPARSG